MRGEDNHCAYLALATVNSNARPSNAQGKDDVDGVERKGEESVHNDVRPSDARGEDNVDGVEQKGEETAYNDTRPSNAQGEDNVDGEMAHNDA